MSYALFSLSFSLKSGREAPPPSTIYPPPSLATYWTHSHLCLWPFSQGSVVWWDLCSTTTIAALHIYSRVCMKADIYLQKHAVHPYSIPNLSPRKTWLKNVGLVIFWKSKKWVEAQETMIIPWLYTNYPFKFSSYIHNSAPSVTISFTKKQTTTC